MRGFTIGTNRALLDIMNDGAKYADFVVRMLACEQAEIADIAKRTAKVEKIQAIEAGTVRPLKNTK